MLHGVKYRISAQTRGFPVVFAFAACMVCGLLVSAVTVHSLPLAMETAYLNGDYETVIAGVEEWLSGETLQNADEETLAAGRYFLARSLLATDRIEDADRVFFTIIIDFPKTQWAERAILGLGDCYFYNEQYDRAGLQYEKFIAFLPENAPMRVYANLLEIYRRSDNVSEINKVKNWFGKRLPYLPNIAGITDTLLGTAAPPIILPTGSLPDQNTPQAATPPTIPIGSFYILVGLFGSSENIKRNVGLLNENGYLVETQQEIRAGLELTKLLVGPYIDQAAADLDLPAINSLLKVNAVVIRKQ